ncbi:MAG: ATP-binding cassette domain-containing protein [Anaerolineae bacterium]|nr:ATP-binding cassette domain-containing protein [Anaerolineae bacterium]
MTESIIQTTGLSRRFRDVVAVDKLSLEVPRNSIYGFLGPNGAGKTTTIRMLLGLIRPDAGEVRLFGQSLRRQPMAALRKVGALVESPSLYPHLTGRENLELTRRLVDGNRAQVDRALCIVKLEDAANRPVKTYSLGMRQRLGLALALLRSPELLILDEPTNGLDPAGILEMRELICNMPNLGISVFLSSHLLREVEQMATHIGIVQKGRLLFQGTTGELHAQVDKHLVIEVDQPQQAKTVLHNAGWRIQSNGQSRLAVAANNLSDAAMINAQLVHANINVYHLTLEQPTLEDIFLSLTTTATA